MAERQKFDEASHEGFAIEDKTKGSPIAHREICKSYNEGSTVLFQAAGQLHGSLLSSNSAKRLHFRWRLDVSMWKYVVKDSN